MPPFADWAKLYIEWPKFSDRLDKWKAAGIDPSLVNEELMKHQKDLIDSGKSLPEIVDIKGSLDPIEEYISNTGLEVILRARDKIPEREAPRESFFGEGPPGGFEDVGRATVGAFGKMLHHTFGRIDAPIMNLRNGIITAALDPNIEFGLSDAGKAIKRGITLEQYETGVDLIKRFSGEEFRKDHPYLTFGGGMLLDLITPPFGFTRLGRIGQSTISAGIKGGLTVAGKGLSKGTEIARKGLSDSANTNLDEAITAFNGWFRAGQDPTHLETTASLDARQNALEFFHSGSGKEHIIALEKLAKDTAIESEDLAETAFNMTAFGFNPRNLVQYGGVQAVREAAESVGGLAAEQIAKLSDKQIKALNRFSWNLNDDIVKYTDDLVEELGIPNPAQKTIEEMKLTTEKINEQMQALIAGGVTNIRQILEFAKRSTTLQKAINMTEDAASTFPKGARAEDGTMLGKALYLEQLQTKIEDTGILNLMWEFDLLASELGANSKFLQIVLKPEALRELQKNGKFASVIEGESLSHKQVKELRKLWSEKGTLSGRPEVLTMAQIQEKAREGTLPLINMTLLDGAIETNQVLIHAAQVTRGERLKARLDYITNSLRRYDATPDFLREREAARRNLERAVGSGSPIAISKATADLQAVDTKYPSFPIEGRPPGLVAEFATNEKEIAEAKAVLSAYKDLERQAPLPPKGAEHVLKLERELADLQSTGGMQVRLPKEVFDYMKKVEGVFTGDKQFRKLINFYDTNLRSWISLTLPLFPGYTLRNFTTTLQYLWFEDVSLKDMWIGMEILSKNSKFGDALSSARKRFEQIVPGTVKDAREIAKGDAIVDFEGNVVSFDLLQEISPQGISGRGFFATQDPLTLKDVLGVGPKNIVEAAKNFQLSEYVSSKLATSSLLGGKAPFLPVREGFQANTYLENVGRMALMVKNIRKGKDSGAMKFLRENPEAAGKFKGKLSEELNTNEMMKLRAGMMEVKKNFPDHSQLTQFERTWVRRVFPFYGWQRFNIPRQLELIMNKPEKFASLQRVQANQAEAFFANPTPGPEPGRPFDPDGAPRFFQVNGPMQFATKDGDLYALTTVGWFPWSDLEPFVAMNQKTAVGAIANMASPFFRLPFELGLGRNFATGAPLEGPSKRFLGTDMSPSTIHALKTLRILSTANRAFDLGEFRGQSAGLRFVQFLPGVSITGVDKKQFRGVLVSKFYNELKKMRGALIRAKQDGDEARVARLKNRIRDMADRTKELLQGVQPVKTKEK